MNQQPKRASRQQFVQPILGLFFVLLVLAGASAGSAADPRPAVRLVVDYGDGVQLHFTTLPWKEGMTVLDAIADAQKHPRGFKLTQKGRGTSAMITEIGGLKNEGNGKNWLFSVNDKSADVGAGSYELKSGDTILWEFKAYEYNQ